jgi:very-short-patch-repair endonuclease
VLRDGLLTRDVLLARGTVGWRELREGGAALGGVRGARRARQATTLADPRAESPPESRLRVLLTLAGLPAVPQYAVRDEAGTFVARVDPAFPDRRIAVEYDGLWHAEPGQFGRDRRRIDPLVAAGWIVLHVRAADLHDPEVLVARVRELLAVRESGEVGL